MDGHEDLFGDNDETDHFFLPEHYNNTKATEYFPVVDNNSIASSGLGDDDLPEEEEATGPVEDVDYEELIAQARRNTESGGDAGNDIHMPDFGGLPPEASGAMARWMAGVEQPGREDEIQDELLSKEDILREFYPSFRSNEVLNFSDLFSAKAGTFSVPIRRVPKPCVPTKITLEVEADGEAEFASAKRRRVQKDTISTKMRSVTIVEHDEIQSDLDENDNDLVLACADWDRLIDAPEVEKDTMMGPKLRFTDEPRWIDDDIFSGNLDAHHISLDLNDPHLFLSEHAKSSASRRRANRVIPRRYNISNDEAYGMLQETHQSKLRSTLTQLTIEHAGFSDRLQSPYYKTLLTKAEARAFHRPSMTFRANQEIHFRKLKPRKKKKDRSRDPKVTMQYTKDISLSDNTGYVCLEYSEEYPTILSNAGMGSKIINYYRKKSDEDEFRPKEDYGETQVLGPTDRSPFWNFGFVEPGETTRTIYNRLYRAPIFRHAPPSTDFLFIKTLTKAGTRFYLRNMKHLYTVGQTLPVIDVPGPHSRKVTTSYKNRLKMIAYRLVRRNDQGRLMIKELMRHFPDQNEMQIRQRLKDFMEYQRKGEDQGYWRLKTGDLLPSEEATRAMIDPETVCLISAMQVGLRHLEDSGYGKSAEADDDLDENMTAEQQLAPWIATRNFLNATQGKAMLQLYGEGDPTGRGEGISFMRTSMKGGFKPAGESVNDVLDGDKKGAHAYNVAKQARAYDDEIARVWNAQKTSLSMTRMMDDEPMQPDFEGASPFDVAPSPSAASEDDDMMSLNSAMSSTQNKVLRIERVIRDSSGTVTTKTEIVTDPHVIHAYVTKRRLQDETQLANDDAGPTNDEDTNKRVRLQLEANLARLKRNQERRRLRKIAKENGTLKTKKKDVVL